ncbi:hypothetical protein ACH5RR_033190 [Cinchona calisaya]|uniref:Uncharacterized protein n=1 Tax=Cinchona calisaya TaxID=153742 RepID=A0ABD2YKA1_9GENT
MSKPKNLYENGRSIFGFHNQYLKKNCYSNYTPKHFPSTRPFEDVFFDSFCSEYDKELPGNEVVEDHCILNFGVQVESRMTVELYGEQNNDRIESLSYYIFHMMLVINGCFWLTGGSCLSSSAGSSMVITSTANVPTMSFIHST